MKAPLTFLLVFATASMASAALIVDLLPGAARFDSLTDNDDVGGGFAAGNPTGAENAAGLTFNVTFTPSANDLPGGANALVTTNAMDILEIGGDANGSGLYLFNGELHFISKMNGGAGNIPAFNDLDLSSGNNMIGVKSSFGTLTAGTEYSVAVLFDPITNGTLDIGVKAGAGGVATESYSITGLAGKDNWSGDDSATAFRGNPPNDVANFGGANTNAADPFSEARMNANVFSGTQGQALYWSLNGSIIPEPSSALLGLLGGLALCVRRQRK